jgi:hypothetical protein
VKNFIKIFFIVICFFISLSANAKEINYSALISEFSQQERILDSISIPDNAELVLSDDINENSIVAANNQRHEISASSSKRDTYNGGTIERTSAQNKLLQQIFTSNYNKTLFRKSHKISPHLKNEICTRAP